MTAEQREQLRLAVYHRFAADERRLVLADAAADPDDVHVLMAHPFSAIPLGFAVMGPATLSLGLVRVAAFAGDELRDKPRGPVSRV